jgi:hypothetical protein
MIEVGARSNLATWDRNATGDSTAYLAALSDISTGLGGPSVQQVLSAGADTSALAAQVRSLHPETQLGIWHIFKNAYYEYKGTNIEQALAIARFGRSALEPAAWRNDDAYSRILVRHFDEHYNPSGGITSTPSTPEVAVLAPLQGATVGPNPTLQLRITTGDYRYTTVDLTKLRFRVDGVDRSYEVVVQSDLDLSFTQGVDFETLTLTLPTTLQPGSHSASVYVVRSKVAGDPQAGPEGETITWSFTVSDTPPPDPTTETRSSTKDALVFEKSPHSNEGANPRLTLEKINGKASRNLLGFDLSGVNTNSLTSATLVLSIDPSDQVSGWGNGETVSVKPVTVAWQEGNGKKHGLPGNQQTAGSGVGTTWFSPTDENISNNSSNGVVQWNGAATYATTGTAPALTLRNNQTGELRFDVTDDVLNGVTNGWLLRKDAENKGSKVSFYSREGGGANLGPRLILEYGGPTGMSAPQRISAAVVGFLGLSTRPVSLRAIAGNDEGPVGLRSFLRRHASAAFLAEQVLAISVVGPQGRVAGLGTRLVYRSWLRGAPSLV